ncbi:DUF4440 domain-containing protein [Streptomyces diacarni]|uniref:DUF4440 domain-containing protein n=2 Tax=Streptomyces diacarni TaxID=2800381 RepID=A0A367ET52_9ACTN|nr:DUF4440 domain-containing protein [Streptomyces diacarni]
MYEPGAVFVSPDGTVADTPRAVARANADFLALGLPLSVRPRHTYVADEVALLIVDWEIDGTGPDGARVHLRGTATDVARRGADGHWRYVIDRPAGNDTVQRTPDEPSASPPAGAGSPRAVPSGRRIA